MTDLTLINAPVTHWAGVISILWQKTAEGFINTGRALVAAKKALGHGDFGAMCESQLPFTPRTAQRLMAIAEDPRLADPQNAPRLPPSWDTLYTLTRLKDDDFAARISDGRINPDMRRTDVVNGARAIAPGRQEAPDSLDFFPTPPWATRALMERVMPHLQVSEFGSVWEPACGEGHMVEPLREYFDEVLYTDAFDYGYGNTQVQNFLDYSGDAARTGVDWVITNPPFDHRAEQFALKAIALAYTGVALFTRWQWIETVGRYERLFSKFPPTLVCPFAERVPLHKGRYEPDGDTLTAYCWIVWMRNVAPKPLFWIPPGCRSALTREDDAARFTQHPVPRREPMIASALPRITAPPRPREAYLCPLQFWA